MLTAVDGADGAPMKVMFLFQVLTPYTNALMNRLQSEHGLDIVNVVPKVVAHVGAGVRHSEEGIMFRVYELTERQTRKWNWRFEGLWRILLKERPDIVVAPPVHTLSFAKYWHVRLVMSILRIKLVMRTIPFRETLYPELVSMLRTSLRRSLQSPSPFAQSMVKQLRLPGRYRPLAETLLSRVHYPLRWMIGTFWVEKALRVKRTLYRFPVAHLTYIPDGVRVISSHGVPKETIFPTYNSPDTDVLLRVREHLAGAGIEKKPHRSIHVGRLVDWKRVDLLINAFAQVRTRIHDADLLVVGNGPKRDEWQQLARDKGLGEVVTFVPGVYDPLELGKLFMSSSLYVLAGIGGLSINEAMCFELPVVCSVCDGTEKDLVVDGQNGFYFREGDVDDLAAKMLAVLRDPQRAAAMGRCSLSTIEEKINIHTVSARFAAAFRQIAGSCRQPNM